jgi:Family of unknown function (DUF6370)
MSTFVTPVEIIARGIGQVAARKCHVVLLAVTTVCCGWLVNAAVGQGTQPPAGKNEPVTLKGKLTCAKCELNMTTRCVSVIVVKEAGKDVVYYLDVKTHKKYHAEICSEARPGQVRGLVSVVDGKHIITVSELIFDK